MKKNTIKKLYFLGLILFVIGLFAFEPTISYAQPDIGLDLVEGAAEQGGFDPATNETTFAETIGSFIRLILSLVGVIFSVLTVYAGFLWMTARGEESQVEKAKTTLRNALIGLFVAIASYSITGFVMQAIETTNVGSEQTLQSTIYYS